MGARKTKGTKDRPWDEKTRERIKTSMIINRLVDHILGKVDMVPSQVTAALGLLKKTMPDLQSTEIKGDITNNHYVVSSEPLSEDEWEKQYSRSLEATTGTAKSIN